MLVAHVVPGYFGVSAGSRGWPASWSRWQRAALWAVALGSTGAPDVDVIFNTALRGFINHSTLWTHSVFVYLAVALCWWLLHRSGRWPFAQALLALVTIGGLSHLALDAFAHSTPLLYPLSMLMIGAPPARVVAGGFWAYVTDPIVLAEPVLLALAATHWLYTRPLAPRLRRLALAALASALLAFTVAFLLMLPELQAFAAARAAA